MSLSLGNILDQLAFESGVIEDHAGVPDEITIVTDDTVTELEANVEDMAKEMKAAEQSADAADKMVDVVMSLESKLVMLRELRQTGTNLNMLAAKQFMANVETAFESRGFPVTIYGGDVTSAVTSFESRTAYDYSTEAEDKTVGMIAKVKAMLKKAVSGFIMWLKNMRSKLSGLNKGIGQLGQKLVQRSKGIATNATTERKVKISGLSAIADGKDSLDPIAAIDAVERASKEAESLENDMAGIIGKVAVQMATAGSEPGVDARVVGKAEIKLFGNKSMKLGDDGTYKLAGEQPNTEGEHKPLSATEIGTIGRKLVQLGTTLDVSEADQTKLIARLEAGVDAVIKNLGDKGLSSSGPILKQFNLGLSALKTVRGNLNTYAAQVAKQAYRFASMSANAY